MNGKTVEMTTPEPMGYNCSIVGNSADGLQEMPQADNACIEYVKTSVDNDDFAYGGNVPVTFTFDTGTVEAVATVAAPTVKSGETDRQPEKKH